MRRSRCIRVDFLEVAVNRIGVLGSGLLALSGALFATDGAFQIRACGTFEIDPIEESTYDNQSVAASAQLPSGYAAFSTLHPTCR